MDANLSGPSHANTVFGPSSGLRIGKQILNAIAERAAMAADRSRFAVLPERYLDDAGLTAGERAAALGFAEMTLEPWRVVALHL